jgi:hypothetical protein
MPVQRDSRGAPARPTVANRHPPPVTDQTDMVRARAQEVGDALVAGDVERAITHLSDELRRNLGEVMALLPLPAVEATIESIERSGSGAHIVVFNVVGETDENQIQTRWKDRDGEPRIVEVSHLSRREREPAPAEGLDEGEAEPSSESAPA